MRRTLLILVVLLVALAAGVYVFARSVLASDLVRSALERQLTARLGEPVRIGSASAAVFPRVSLALEDVSVGDPATAVIGEIRIVTGLRPLFSRRIADAEVVVSHGRLAAPLLAAFAAASPEAGATPGAAASFSVTSVRDLSLRDLTVTGGGRALAIDLDSSIDGDQLRIARLVLRAGKTQVEATGALTSMSRLEGTLDARAAPLDLNEMLATASALTAADGPGGTAAGTARPSPMHLAVTLTAPSGTFNAYEFTDLSATLDIVSGRVALAPLALRAFGGRFDGTLEADTSQPVPQLQLSGQLDGFDVVALMKASGSTGGVSGRLGGTVSLQASGTDPATLLRSGRGTIDAVISDGSIPGLDLVRTVVLAFGKPTGAPVEGSGTGFSRLGGRFAMAGGTLRSDNLAMASRDLDLAGTLTLNLETGALASRADVVLSRDLTAQAGTDLRRYAQEDGRVVVPATLGGTLERPSVSLDLASATRRAIGNELRRRTKSFLDGLLNKKDR
jgi:uncharacterized protein involved in outer membrane biogenesis